MRVDRIRLSGIGDEAAPGIDRQIAAVTRLGWDSVELRSVDGTALADLDDAAFKAVSGRLAAAGLGVSCVDSRIGNWARTVRSPFEDDLAELDRLAERCAALGTRFVRIMSYPNDGLSQADWEYEVLARMEQLAARAERAGLVLVHENCAGWAASDPARMLRLVEAGGPALRLLFDVGNGIAYGYEAHELLPYIAPYVEHVHIKDGTGDTETQFYSLPGDGRCRVADSLRYLFDRGYRGTVSIEPHLNIRPHEGWSDPSGDYVDQFVAYGRRLEALVGALGAADTAGVAT
ncbi:sugar phosphate isomerase/epimerase family protein [Streptomyces sp. SCSIO ZS0520]|uniref:sugar phosphate isomerase/epimerase family protein n=1 Tax=Streptomyces sp. SCSIO ZS0520 TaxID=2892996 RepID=UPI0021DACE94|nr:sugar phosphate isomerase/epimerase family protein [Streptomyces sp. SCSIO ZS0520]UFZ14069.1 xylose phosphate isomerase/epimerase [Streptomyces sp.]